MRRTFHRALSCTAALAFGLVAVLAHYAWAQDAPNGSSPQTTNGNAGVAAQAAPVIRTTTRLVQISVVVTDKKGQPVTGLKKEDFTILDGGRAQAITAFSSEEPVAPSQPPRTLPPNIFTNRQDKLGVPPGSNTVIFLDALNTNPRDQEYARGQVIKFLKTIQPQDHFAIYALTGPGQVEIVHEFTQDDTALIAAMKQYQGKLPAEAAVPFTQGLDPSDLPPTMLPMVPQDSLAGSGGSAGHGVGQGSAQSERQDILREEYERFRVYPEVAALIGIANHVAAIPGRKNLIWISGGVRMSVQGQDLPQKVKLADFGYRLGSPEYATRESELIRAVGESMNMANVVMYGVDVRGTTVDPGMDVAQRSGSGPGGVPTPMSALRSSQGRLDREQALRDTYRDLAELTGGSAFYGNNDLPEGMSKAFDDGRYAYTLGFYPDHGTWDGKFRKIQIKVNDEKVNLRYRDGYYATQENDPSEVDPGKQMNEVAQSPLDATALSMMVSGRHMPGTTGRELEFQVGVDVAQLLLEHTDGHYKGGIDLMFVQRDDKWNVIAAEKKHIDLNLTDAQYQGLLTKGAIFERHLALDTSAKEVRAVVRDAGSGMIGSVSVPLKGFFTEK
jgi:VWFA-related protein